MALVALFWVRVFCNPVKNSARRIEECNFTRRERENER